MAWLCVERKSPACMSFYLVFERASGEAAHTTTRTKRGRQKGDQAKHQASKWMLLTLPVAPPAFLANSTTIRTHMTFGRKS